MRKALRCYAAIRFFLIAAALSAWGLGGANAGDARAEIVATDLRFPEGTIFIGNDLYFVDYARSSVLRLVGGKTEAVWHQDGCGANGLVAVPDGLLVACFDSGLIVRISPAGATLTTIRADDHGQAFVAPNDLVADQKGGIYVSDSGIEPSRQGLLSVQRSGRARGGKRDSFCQWRRRIARWGHALRRRIRQPAKYWPSRSRQTDPCGQRAISFGFATFCPRAGVEPSRRTRSGSMCTGTSSLPYTTVVAWPSFRRPVGFLRCSTCHPSITPTLPSARMGRAFTSPRSTTTLKPPIAARSFGWPIRSCLSGASG